MWWGARCNGHVLYISYLTTTDQHFTSNRDISSTAHHTTRSHITWPRDVATVWCGIWCDVKCFAMPDAGCCALYNVAVMWSEVQCRMCHMVRCYTWCHAMSDEVWNDGVVHVSGIWCCDAVCEMWLWPEYRVSDVEWFDTIRHGSDDWNAVWDVWCSLECVGWGSVMCNLISEYSDVCMA